MATPTAAPLRHALASPLARVARERPPQTLVENRTSFGAERAEFAVYDTFRPAERVPLQARNPLYCGMVTGKKVVHAPTGEAIAFLPEESLVVPSGQTILIDFPGASEAAPTKCLTIEIDRERVRRIVQQLNEAAPRSPDSAEWAYEDAQCCHFTNTPGIERTVGKLASAFTEDHPDRGLLIDLGVQELVVRMLRVEARRLLLSPGTGAASRHGLAAAATFARANLDRPLTVADLAQRACMSEPSFYRAFRAEFGITPLAYLTVLRVRHAERLLADPGRSVTDVSAAVGFASPSHFIRVFREAVGTTPKQFQLARRAAA